MLKNKSILHPKLSYEITGILFKVHNEHGRFKSERNYCDLFERLLLKNNYKFQRETELKKIFDIDFLGNIPDFVIENKIIVDLKNKKFITKDDYFQMLRYLDVVNFPLGLIVNFRSTYLKPKRVLNAKFKYSNNLGAHSNI